MVCEFNNKWKHQAGLLKAVLPVLVKLCVWTLFLIVSAVISGVSEKIPGFLLGVGTSAVYLVLMAKRVEKSAGLPVSAAVFSMRVGWGLRLAFVVMMLIISLKVPGIDFIAAVVGLFSLHIIMLFSVVPFLLKHWLKN